MKGCRTKDGGSCGELQLRYEGGTAGVDDLALLAATLGEWDRALEWLKEACERRAPFLGYVDVEPAMAAFLHHPGLPGAVAAARLRCVAVIRG